MKENKDINTVQGFVIHNKIKDSVPDNAKLIKTKISVAFTNVITSAQEIFTSLNKPIYYISFYASDDSIKYLTKNAEQILFTLRVCKSIQINDIIRPITIFPIFDSSGAIFIRKSLLKFRLSLDKGMVKVDAEIRPMRVKDYATLMLCRDAKIEDYVKEAWYEE